MKAKAYSVIEKAYAVIATKASHEYAPGDLIDIGMYRQTLAMRKQRGTKIVPCEVVYKVGKK